MPSAWAPCLCRLITQGHCEVVGIPQHRHPPQTRRKLLEKLQTLGCDLRRHVRDAGNVPAGPRQAVGQPSCDRISCRKHHHGKRGVGLGGNRRQIAQGDDDPNLACRELGDEPGQAIRVSLRSAAFERQILVRHIAVLGQAAHERSLEGTGTEPSRVQQPDPIDRS
jgi:hypothetical protein